MGQRDGHAASDDILSWVRAYRGGTADSTGSVDFVRIGGQYQATPTAQSPGANVDIAPNSRGHLVAAVGPLLLGSFTTVSAGTNFADATGLGGYKRMTVLVDVSALTGTSATLSCYLDGKFDGTSYVNMSRFTAITASGTTLVSLANAFSTNQAEINGSVDAGAGTHRAIGWPDAIRLRTDIAGTSPSISGRVWVFLTA